MGITKKENLMRLSKTLVTLLSLQVVVRALKIAMEAPEDYDWHKETASDYNFEKNKVGKVGDHKAARITVAADGDALIGLGKNNKHNGKKYIIVLGGSENTWSGIKYGEKGEFLSYA